MKNLLTIVLMFSLQVAYSQCVTTANITAQSCDTNCTGMAVFQANGGQMPYSLWIDGIGPITLTTQTTWGNLCPGVHTFTVVDANGDTCAGSGSFIIPISPPIDATVLVSNASCPTCFDGSATVFSVTGGTPPYFYQWSNGSNVQTQANLQPGMYFVNVIDANGCSDVDTFYVGVGNSPSNSIGGTVYMDLNTNGIKDAGEPGIGGRPIELVSPSIYAITNSSGDYAFVLTNGTYDVNYTPQPGWVLTSSPANYTVSLSGPSIDTLDFGISPDSAYAAAYTDLSSGWPRCNMNVPYYVTLHNSGFTVLNGTLQFTFSPLQTFVSSSVVPASQTGTQVTYNVTGLVPGATFSAIVTLLEPGAGNIVNSISSFTASDAFSNQISGADSLYQTIACSFDPNDKSVAPEGYSASHFVTMNTELDYLIRFQNTGNDTAYTVLVVDTIDTDLDMASFRLTATSHPALVTVKSGNIIEFLFNNIYLPDSNVNEPASHGFIMYRIAGNSGLPDPTEITNSAAIYFDQNPPVITNTVLTTFSDNFLSVNESSGSEDFQVYPNPFTESAVILSKGNVSGEQLLTVYDISGRAVLKGRMEKGRYELQKGSLSRGTYFVHIHSGASGSPVVIRVTVN